MSSSSYKASLERCKVSELQAQCKSCCIPSNGDKPTLIWRLDVYNRCKEKDLQILLSTGENVNPCCAKIGQLFVKVGRVLFKVCWFFL